MRNRLVIRLGSLVLGLGLATLVLLPRPAYALQVQCADENGECKVSNDGSDFIECTCFNDEAFGGTGGDDWANFSEDELMQVCLDELAWCGWNGDTGSDDNWTLGDTFGDSGEWGTDDWGDWGDTFGETFGEGETGMVTDGEEEGTGEDTSGDTRGSTTEDGGSTTDDDGSTTDDGGSTTDDGDSTESDDGESGDGETESGSGSESDSQIGDDELGDGSESDAGLGDDVDLGCSCSTANSPGAGALALFGLLGLLGLRRRRD
jgi:MYXO-CTERM domain-containing protein